jgi:hypothetical protein
VVGRTNAANVSRAVSARLRFGDVASTRGVAVDQVCLVIPIYEDKIDVAREFMRELEQERKGDYAASEQRIGIDKEVWYLAAVPGGTQFVAYMETLDFVNALGMFSQSRDPFDLWFKDRLREATGLDLNHPPEMELPQLVSSYSLHEPTKTWVVRD